MKRLFLLVSIAIIVIISSFCCFADEWEKLDIRDDKNIGGKTGHSASYTEDTNPHYMVVFGDYWWESGTSVWFLNLDLDNPEWTRYDPGGVDKPGVRGGHTAVYDFKNKQMIVFGGCIDKGDGKRVLVLNETYLLKDVDSPNTMSWAKLGVTGDVPPKMVGHSAVYRYSEEEQNSYMIVFGGETDPMTHNVSTNVYVLDIKNSVWLNIETQGEKSPQRCYHEAFWRGDTNEMIIVGGYGGPDSQTIYALDFDSSKPSWSKLDIDGEFPGELGQIAGIYQNTEELNRIVIFGGREGNDQTNNTYIIDLDENKALRIGNIGEVPTRRDSHTAIYDYYNERMLVFGGWSEEQNMDSSVYSFSLTGEHPGDADDTQTWNYPNPFDPNKGSTVIRFYQKNEGDVKIKIFTLTGELVRSEEGIYCREGFNVWSWDGRNGEGRIVEDGGYICLIDSGGEQYKCKIAVLK